MAIALNAVTTTSGSGTGPFTFAHTTSGSDRLLCVCVANYRNTSFVSAVSYNSVDLTEQEALTVGEYTISLWSVIAPSTGSNTVSVTTNTSVFDIGIAAISFTGVHQSSPFGVPVSDSGTSTTPSVTVTSAADEVVLDTLTIIHSGTLTVDGSQTQQWNAATSNAFIKYAGSTEDGAASTTMSWSNSTSQSWITIAIPIKPVSTAVTIRQLCLTGVGT